MTMATEKDDRERLPVLADTVAKVVLHRWSKFLQAGGVVFVQGPEGPRRFTLKSSATLVARLRLHESSISARFKFSPKIQTSANFDFCNSIGTFPTSRDVRLESGMQTKADVRQPP
jgi:hypothetical protein